jgi:hypothetical protein
MRDIRSDLQERANYIEAQISAARHQFAAVGRKPQSG